MIQRIARILRLTQLLALLLVVGMGVVLYGVLAEFERASGWVAHTHEVIDQIEQVRLESLRSGIWLRNFMVAPLPESLQRVRQSADRAEHAADRLAELTQGHSNQVQRIQALDTELAKVLGSYRSLADVAQRDGAAALTAIVASRVSQDATRDLRQLLDQAEAVERELLRSRGELEHERLQLLKRLLAGGGVAFLMVMLWATMYSGRLLRLGRQQVRQLQVDALHDPLTGLLNRRGLNAQLVRMDGQQHDANRRAAVLAFDLDGFKPVNDLHGHAAGDQVLQMVGKRLRQQCRAGDSVARVGGDEFVVILSDVESRQEAAAVAQRIHTCLMQPVRIGGKQMHVGAAMGIAILHEDGCDMQALMQHADAQMYSMKKSGGLEPISGTPHRVEPGHQLAGGAPR